MTQKTRIVAIFQSYVLEMSFGTIRATRNEGYMSLTEHQEDE